MYLKLTTIIETISPFSSNPKSLKTGIGWGWFLLLNFMVSVVKSSKFNGSITFSIELMLFIVTICLYFILRKKYILENTLPNFKKWKAGLMAGFWCYVAFQVGTFINISIDKRFYP